MNIDEIIQLIQAVSENKLTSFELEEGNMKLSLKCKKEQPQIVTVAAPSMDQAAVQALNTAAGAGITVSQVQETAVQTAGVDIGSDKVVTSPLVGTFYESSSPDADAFVKVGDTVKKGQVLGIIEAMKLMNEIESEYDGVVEAILVSNEEVVEYGQPLFRIK
ncbi:acetyl-CoA carboxylase biotin carboxyl carrier protein [Lachnoclostridium pacaense]|uniref:acetyl-CoA carboxylase biotin carboxyl carrier protein n=1 Tax=Enterocloster hominis (ex Hitch et al. 2024) TaxID=1917870 RepID=UPI001D10479A|nr:acetyl-CoA carboxylase biotin carboxyl carrier protein [Lachnoclostridium pacaense]MCC2819887.1 acetyl-CoA carboxylase biotin carboxyl carrier protein [Lachnoclostridium pacaense]